MSIQRFYIYAERGLTRRRVAVWFYQDRLHVEYQQSLLARYHCNLDRSSNKLTNVSRPNIYRTFYAFPQLELFELDDSEWLKILQRPEYARQRKLLQALARQIAFDFNLLLWLFFSS